MIICRSQAEIERMRPANELVADVLAVLAADVAPGVTTQDLDQLAERLVRDAGAEPAFKGYRGYPATLCASVNEEVVHGIPSPKRVLRDGDIISLDMGVKVNGFSKITRWMSDSGCRRRRISMANRGTAIGSLGPQSQAPATQMRSGPCFSITSTARCGEILVCG